MSCGLDHTEYFFFLLYSSFAQIRRSWCLPQNTLEQTRTDTHSHRMPSGRGDMGNHLDEEERQRPGLCYSARETLVPKKNYKEARPLAEPPEDES